MRARATAALCAGVVAVLSGTGASDGAAAAAAPDAVRLALVGRFAEPVAVTAPGGDRRRLFVVERRGRIRLVRDGRLARRPFADLTRRVIAPRGPETVDQRGLFSIAFAPDHARSGLLYAYFVDRRGHLRVDELRRAAADPERIDPRATRTVIDLGRVALQHHGGQLQFGPDGLLWISTGQDDDAASSRDLGSWHGKLLRIDPRRDGARRPYRVPAGNPFRTTPDARPEIMAFGLRNPWRFSFDGPLGLLLIGDVGETAAEEIDALPVPRAAGADFGWDRFEGRTRRRTTAGGEGGNLPGDVRARPVAPAIVHRHSRRWCAVVGGHVARDPALPRLRGRYLYGDVCSGWIWSARLSREGAARDVGRLRLRVPYLVSFGRDGRGRSYAVSLDGAVWRLVAPR